MKVLIVLVAAIVAIEANYKYPVPDIPFTYDPPTQPSGLYEPPAEPSKPSPGVVKPNDGGQKDSDVDPSASGSDPSASGDSPMKYKYAYQVFDRPTKNDYAEDVDSDGKIVTGSYRVVLPDGRTQIVKYTAGPDGYIPDVSYVKEGKFRK